MSIGSIISWIVCGLVVGILARFLVPGRQSMSLLMTIVLGIAGAFVLLAFVGWWDEVFSWFGGLEIHLDLGAYFWFSTLLLVLWAGTLFGLDRLSYWEVTPGQLTYYSNCKSIEGGRGTGLNRQ
jgi:uncharacterized membrane protein YeaQ/YmgE (transglycosylase-associated protein family)